MTVEEKLKKVVEWLYGKCDEPSHCAEGLNRSVCGYCWQALLEESK